MLIHALVWLYLLSNSSVRYFQTVILCLLHIFYLFVLFFLSVNLKKNKKKKFWIRLWSKTLIWGIHILNKRWIVLSEPFINGFKEKETFHSEKEDSFLMSVFLSEHLQNGLRYRRLSNSFPNTFFMVASKYWTETHSF